MGHGRDLAWTPAITMSGFSARLVFLPNFLLRNWRSVQLFLSLKDAGLLKVTGWMGTAL